LSIAVLAGDLAEVESVLRDGADPASTSECNTALFDAIDNGAVEIVETLLNAGADLSRRHPIMDRTPLTAAIEAEDPGLIEVLVRHGVDPTSASLPSLVRGADNPGAVHLALSAGIDVNERDPETGRTALHVAAMYGFLHTVECLLHEGADRSEKDNWGNPPATLAVQNHYERVAELLTDANKEPG